MGDIQGVYDSVVSMRELDRTFRSPMPADVGQQIAAIQEQLSVLHRSHELLQTEVAAERAARKDSEKEIEWRINSVMDQVLRHLDARSSVDFAAGDSKPGNDSSVLDVTLTVPKASSASSRSSLDRTRNVGGVHQMLDLPPTMRMSSMPTAPNIVVTPAVASSSQLSPAATLLAPVSPRGCCTPQPSAASRPSSPRSSLRSPSMRSADTSPHRGGMPLQTVRVSDMLAPSPRMLQLRGARSRGVSPATVNSKTPRPSDLNAAAAVAFAIQRSCSSPVLRPDLGRQPSQSEAGLVARAASKRPAAGEAEADVGQSKASGSIVSIELTPELQAMEARWQMIRAETSALKCMLQEFRGQHAEG